MIRAKNEQPHDALAMFADQSDCWQLVVVFVQCWLPIVKMLTQLKI